MTTPDFGTCLACVSDLTPEMAMATGFDVIAQACVRRLSTGQGQLGSDPNYGADLRNLISSGMDTRKLATIPGVVRNELLKDERVQDVSIAYSYTSPILTLNVTITTAQGPFRLTLSVSAVTVDLLATGTV